MKRARHLKILYLDHSCILLLPMDFNDKPRKAESYQSLSWQETKTTTTTTCLYLKFLTVRLFCVTWDRLFQILYLFHITKKIPLWFIISWHHNKHDMQWMARPIVLITHQIKSSIRLVQKPIILTKFYGNWKLIRGKRRDSIEECFDTSTNQHSVPRQQILASPCLS